jgi:ABC-type branched-subunit amino acid transport system ATPase component
LETNHLREEFGGLVAVKDVSIQVQRGHLRSIIGPNGAGKTTLFNLLSGIAPTRAESSQGRRHHSRVHGCAHWASVAVG